MKKIKWQISQNDPRSARLEGEDPQELATVHFTLIANSQTKLMPRHLVSRPAEYVECIAGQHSCESRPDAPS